MGNRVTIKDVAREANVSIKTVSNVLNDTGSMRPDTRRRVEEVMRKLGYTVNISARAMRSGGTKLIGLNIFDFSQPFVPFLNTRSLNTQKNAITV
ncbi:RbsR-type transcription regulator/ ribose operon repressor [Bifidobacterium longum subsp. longum]|nr:RbsR-type transcription regulator/ ribose operon repressor [Bifidobacterium longum subsp. longum]